MGADGRTGAESPVLDRLAWLSRASSPDVDSDGNRMRQTLKRICWRSLDWTELEIRAEAIRASKLKSAAGRPPHLRALLGALILRALRSMPLRVLADQIRYYAPARYLCGLAETEWSPDYRTLHDFFKLMGEEGELTRFRSGEMTRRQPDHPGEKCARLDSPRDAGACSTHVGSVRAVSVANGSVPIRA